MCDQAENGLEFDVNFAPHSLADELYACKWHLNPSPRTALRGAHAIDANERRSDLVPGRYANRTIGCRQPLRARHTSMREGVAKRTCWTSAMVAAIERTQRRPHTTRVKDSVDSDLSKF